MRLFYVWRGLDEWRAESATIELGDEGLDARGVQIGREHRLRYELRTDAQLITQALLARVQTRAGERSLELVRDADGGWRANGEPQPDVEGALDCDLALSPLTNFMPARRLGDKAADLVMAWVSVPGPRGAALGAALRARRRPGRVRFVGLEDGFTAELELDEHGFVVRYPGLAERASG